MSGVGLPTRTLGAENFPPRFFFVLCKSAYRCVDNIRANLIAQKNASNIRGGFLGSSALLCKGKTLPGLIGSEAVFEGLRANLQKNRTLVWRCCLRSVFFRLRVILPGRGFCKARRLPRGRRRRARNPGCRSRLQIRMWHSRRLRGR